MEKGKYRGDDVSVFGRRVHSDNDTRAPTKMIKVQNEIIGEAADGIAEHRPDIGHIIKNTSGEFFGIREKDSSF